MTTSVVRLRSLIVHKNCAIEFGTSDKAEVAIQSNDNTLTIRNIAIDGKIHDLVTDLELIEKPVVNLVFHNTESINVLGKWLLNIYNILKS